LFDVFFSPPAFFKIGGIKMEFGEFLFWVGFCICLGMGFVLGVAGGVALLGFLDERKK
jgi:hypothetical protein